MSIFYRPENAVLGDVIPFYDKDDNTFKPFYLRNFRENRDSEHFDSWVMLTTKDHVHFTEHDTRIVGGTGSVIKVDGVYHMFYCTFKQFPERGFICHAVSNDLDTWTDIPEDAFRSDDHIYGQNHFRDPFVFYVEEEQCYWMIFASQAADNTTARRGCVGLAKSKDLHKWQYCEPLYAPKNAQCAFECPDLFQWGDWYYLVFSSYSDRFQTLYRMSKSLNGPWIAPKIDTFDTRAFYAAKTGSDGNRRFIYGWNPTRETDEHAFDPRESSGKDCNTWDWGGNMIVHELKQNPDGTLAVAAVPEVENAFSKEKLDCAMTPLCGSWKTDGNNCTADVPYSYASMLVGEMPSSCRITMQVTLDEVPKSLGVALHVGEEFAEGYYVNIDPFRKRMEYKTSVRMTEKGGQKFPYEVELERPLPDDILKKGSTFTVEILCEDSVLEVYVAGQIAMGTRMFDITGGSIGIFASEGKVSFTDIKMWKC